jgi:hypothetical protein
MQDNTELTSSTGRKALLGPNKYKLSMFFLHVIWTSDAQTLDYSLVLGPSFLTPIAVIFEPIRHSVIRIIKGIQLGSWCAHEPQIREATILSSCLHSCEVIARNQFSISVYNAKGSGTSIEEMFYPVTTHVYVVKPLSLVPAISRTPFISLSQCSFFFGFNVAWQSGFSVR